MCEDDFKYLAVSHFADWKNFVIMRYLRTELDMGNQEKPLTRIVEAETKDEGNNIGQDLAESAGEVP